MSQLNYVTATLQLRYIRRQVLQEIEQAADGGALPSSYEAAMTVSAQYDNLFVAFNDALESVRTDLRSNVNDKAAAAGVARGHLQKLQTGLTWQKHNHTVRRTQLLVEGFKAACVATSSGDSSVKKVSRPRRRRHTRTHTRRRRTHTHTLTGAQTLSQTCHVASSASDAPLPTSTSPPPPHLSAPPASR